MKYGRNNSSIAWGKCFSYWSEWLLTDLINNILITIKRQNLKESMETWSHFKYKSVPFYKSMSPKGLIRNPKVLVVYICDWPFPWRSYSCWRDTIAAWSSILFTFKPSMHLTLMSMNRHSCRRQILSVFLERTLVFHSIKCGTMY